MPVHAVIFDAFGTLLRIQNGRHPYRQLLAIGRENGRRPRPDDASVLMEIPLTLTQAAAQLEIPASPEQLEFLERVLAHEIAAIEPFPDGPLAVQLLQRMDVRVGVCSNLAFPYREAVLRCYPDLDAYAFSCELGVMKPDPAIYRWSCNQLGVEPGATWMVGDSMRCDREGPASAGLRGFFLERGNTNGDYTELESFAVAALTHEM
ncbi:MAG: FMN phosphatase YigB (HAD superfamily) [Bacteroidia bacterium]|jgi:FMN phosphatase YigB (HAD superfamily)